MKQRKKEKRIKRNEDNLRDLWDNVKCPKIRIIGVPEEDKNKDNEKIFEIIIENFHKLGKEIISQVQETQSLKQDKRPPNQTKKEEIGNLPDKEFQIMIVKMIQNLENKKELQINNLETRIQKMQERFNKDLEEIKKSQYIMNNAINEIKNTIEGTKNRITEAEDRISEVEDRMVEVN